MDKISSIISSARNQVDMSKERPVRAGAPTYGQPISPATQTFQKIQKEEELMGVTPKYQSAFSSGKIESPEVSRHSGIIDKITFSFRGNSERPEGPLVERVIDMSTGEVVEVPNAEQFTPEQFEADGAEPKSLDVYA